MEASLDEAEEVVGVVLPPHEHPALPLQPCEVAFDKPATHVAPQGVPLLGLEFAVAEMRSDHLGADDRHLRATGQRRSSVLCWTPAFV